MIRRPPRSTLFPYTSSSDLLQDRLGVALRAHRVLARLRAPLHHLHQRLHRDGVVAAQAAAREGDRKSTRLNSSHSQISYAVFCLKKKKSTLTWPGQITHHLH